MSVLLSLLLAATPQMATGPAKPICQEHGLRVATRPERARPRTLAEMPPARQVYTVLRTENGCSKPVLVNDRVIGAPAR